MFGKVSIFPESEKRMPYFGLSIEYPEQLSKRQKQNMKVKIGPSGLRALPLAAGINVGGHYKWLFFLFLSLLSLQLIANSPRRGCRRNSNFCMGS